MKQLDIIGKYRKIKENHPDYLLVFQNDYSCKLYSEDAIIVSKTFNIPLIEDVFSFPCSELDTYLSKLIRLGYKVAVCSTT